MCTVLSDNLSLCYTSPSPQRPVNNSANIKHSIDGKHVLSTRGHACMDGLTLTHAHTHTRMHARTHTRTHARKETKKEKVAVFARKWEGGVRWTEIGRAAARAHRACAFENSDEESKTRYMCVISVYIYTRTDKRNSLPNCVGQNDNSFAEISQQ